MRIDFLNEPELEFGAGRHVDIRFGLMNYGPLDYAGSQAPKQIKLGLVGTPQTIEGLQTWLERCRSGIDAKPSRQPNLFPRFPGLGPEVSFRCSLVTDSQLQRPVQQNVFDRLGRRASGDSLVTEAAEIVLSEFRYLVENCNVDVLICAIPMSLLEAMDTRLKGDADAEGDEPSASRLNFHHLLKARGMGLKKPIQIILPMTYDKATRRRQKLRPERVRQIQDEATIAWNLHTALYYKAGGIPWRLVRDPTQLTACYVGVSFYKTLDNATVMTSVAQVFNQRGEGVIVRGGTAKITKEDRQPHLSGPDAQKLLKQALDRYWEVHRTLPARVVLHKTSPFNAEEMEGFVDAVEQSRVALFDFVSVGDCYTRVLRNGVYPTLRGTLLHLDERVHALYTRGSVDFFETYPGLYVPLPLLFRRENTVETARTLAQEMLALTKMNWNNTQFDRREPITVRAARQVGAILKYIDDDAYVEVG